MWSTPANLAIRTAVVLSLIALSVLPVTLSAVAPVETVAREPKVVAAPMQGVVRDILVSPSSRVNAGQALVQFDDTAVRNDYEIARRKVDVAQAKVRKSAHGAFDDIRSKNDLAIAKAELALAISERDYAAALLDKSVLKAPNDGVVIFGHKKDWIGQPVSIGEKIMQVANPEQFEFRIDLPVKDAIVLKNDAKVVVFLDSHPLDKISARVMQISYEAKPTPDNILAYRIFARADNSVDAGKLAACSINPYSKRQMTGS